MTEPWEEACERLETCIAGLDRRTALEVDIGIVTHELRAAKAEIKDLKSEIERLKYELDDGLLW